MRLTVIGCCGSFAGPHSAASSYLLQCEVDGRTWNVLIDLGSGAFGPLQDAIDPADLDAVIISHLHPDHFLDITGLEVYRAYHERTDLPCLPVYAPAALPSRLRALMGRESDVPDGVVDEPFDFRPLADGAQLRIGPLEVEVGEVRHPVESFAFRITCGGKVLTYSGDTDTSTRLLELARDADLFLCEAGYIEGRDDRFEGVHLTGRRAGEAATEAGARSLVLTHIASWTDPEIPLAEAQETYAGPIRLAAPGQTTEI